MDLVIKEIPELVFETLQANMAAAPQWMPKIITDAIKRIGPKAVKRMRSAVMPNRYTGALDQSIQDDYEDSGLTVVVGPTALRGGRHDAGVLLELGVPHPIPRAPYQPSAAWANVRGAPMPQVWLGIRAHGVHAHPFLDNTVTNVEPDLNDEQDKILGDMIAHALSGTEPAG